MRRLDEIKRDTDAALAPCPPEVAAEPNTWDTFIGPCPHGRDPFTRCDEEDDPRNGGCGRLSSGEARWLAGKVEARFELAADVPALVALVERLRDALNPFVSAVERAKRKDYEINPYSLDDETDEARAALAAADGTARDDGQGA